MTVLNSEQQLVVGGARVLPRVNLLPPEIAEQARLRRIQAGLGACVLGAVGVVGVLYLSATHAVSSANSELATAKTQKAELDTQIARYNDVTRVYAQVDAARAQLRTAMWDEVRYSQVLNDLSLAIPSNVWMKSLGIASAAPAANAAATTAAGGVAAVTVTADTVSGTAPALLAKHPVATMTVQGVGFSHDDVATWLEAIAGVKQYANPYFSNSTESLMGARKVVNFSSTATVNGLALSGRYARRG